MRVELTADLDACLRQLAASESVEVCENGARGATCIDAALDGRFV
jgi:hypothetical protein